MSEKLAEKFIDALGKLEKEEECRNDCRAVCGRRGDRQCDIDGKFERRGRSAAVLDKLPENLWRSQFEIFE